MQNKQKNPAILPVMSWSRLCVAGLLAFSLAACSTNKDPAWWDVQQGASEQKRVASSSRRMRLPQIPVKRSRQAFQRDFPDWVGAKNTSSGNRIAQKGSRKTSYKKTGRSRCAISVRRGDTLHEIAVRHDVSLKALARANRIPAPYAIRAGQCLVSPAGTKTVATARPEIHAVRKGETLYAIARHYGLTVEHIRAANRLGRRSALRVGQKLQLAPVTRTAGKTPAPRPRAKAALVPPPLARGHFIWPVEGRVLSRFGAKKHGLYNDGINIAAPEGTPVRVAQSGVVVYAGNELKAYGNLLMIRHEKGWTSIYAHNSRLIAKRGQKVNRGDVIALSGKSGSVAKPQLHFELRKNAKAYDPVQVLKRPQVAKAGTSRARKGG